MAWRRSHAVNASRAARTPPGSSVLPIVPST